MDFQAPIDYLVIGHISRDLTTGGPVIGGTAAYSASTAKVLGCRTAVVTSFAAADELDSRLSDITVHNITAPATTTFENIYQPDGRVQYIHAVAGKITAEDIPPVWQRAKIVHIGPIANEVDPRGISLFSNSIVGLTPQGWMRRWERDGRVFARSWDEAEALLPLAAATFISDEDLLSPSMLNDFRRFSKLLVMTQGPAGCIVYFGEEARSFLAPKVNAVDLTGAGDIFATAYLVRLHQTAGDPWEAARFANDIASQSVTGSGLANKMQVLQEYLSHGC
ncbi:MAG: PfkB family carbohydrate kinase [Candidatus Promineifilaceae bacterium]|jgi:sugar/nucleoside kinase (ribokinase family)